METRLIIAYLLIALLVAAAAFAVRAIAHKRREHRHQLMRGHRLDVVAGGRARPR